MASRSLRRRSFSYIEAVISVVILGSSIVAGLQMFGGYVRGVTMTADEGIARELAADLMAEIIAQQFEDPDNPPGSFGRESFESGGSRADYDDVDDYDGWTESPPEAADGTALGGTEYAGFKRKVTVENVDLDTLGSIVTDGSSPAKRIIVEVTRERKMRARLVAYRTRHDAWD